MSSEIAQKLSKQTAELVSRFENRVDSFNRRDDLMGLTIGVDRIDAGSFAKEYFGEGEYRATGIDGSMGFDERMQMMLFYSNATAYSCPFVVGDAIAFDLKSAARDEHLSVSSAIPLWSEDFSSVLENSPELEIELEHSIEKIPNAFMTLGELYLAWKALGKSRVVFLDRPLSGTYSSLSRDYAIVLRRRGISNLTRSDLAGGLKMLDLLLGLRVGPPTFRLPTRPRFLTYAIIRELMKAELTFAQLSSALSVKRNEVTKAVKMIEKLDKRYGGSLILDSGADFIRLRPEVGRYWEKLITLVLGYSRSVFEQGVHPLLLKNDEWLNVLDVNAISLILLQHLRETAVGKRVLLIGIAKDTTATDITRAALPFAVRTEQIKLNAQPPKLKNDRAFLAIFSAENTAVKTPWRTFGYDSCFSTVVQREDTGEFTSARKFVSQERLFVRAFFQLRTLRTDPHLRSQVFLFDRFWDERFDTTSAKLDVTEERSGMVEVRPYFEPEGGSRVSNLVLHILSLTDNPEVFEAFGHNQLLYLSDKAVKAEVRLMRSSLRGVADLRVGGMSRRRRISGIGSTYREQRWESEEARVRAASSYGD